MESVSAGLKGMIDRGELLKTLHALRNGDFSARMPQDLTGLDGEIARALNEVVALNQALAREIVRVGDEVGREGQLAQRVRLPDAAGAWAECAEAVNALIADLTHPVAEVGRVIGAVAKGDLSQPMVLESGERPLRGDVASLKESFNEMIRTLKDSTRKNTEQDWLKTHLARFTRMLQGHRDLVTVSRLILSELTPLPAPARDAAVGRGGPFDPYGPIRWLRALCAPLA